MIKAPTWLTQPTSFTLFLIGFVAFNSIGTFDVVAEDGPVRYDGSQLWRIPNIPATVRTKTLNSLPEMMESQFGVNIWRDGSDYLDVSIDAHHVAAAKQFLKKFNLEPKVLNSNIQNLFDREHSTGANLTHAGEGHRIKRAISSGMHWRDYQDLTTIHDFLREMAEKYPKICTLLDIGTTAEGRKLYVLRISENPSAYKKIWIDGGIHAREWVSPATVTFIINTLLVTWNNQPAYMRQKTWLIMPVVNPDGYVYSRDFNRLWRKNRNPNKGSQCIGVDINRNFDIGWSVKGSSINPCSDVYRGPSPASELETQAIVKFLREQNTNLEAYLTYHSYSQAIVYPWAYTASRTNNADELQRVGDLAAQRIKSRTGKIYKCDVTYRVFGIAGGGSDDWTRSALGTKYVYTVEMRDQGEFGFALPPTQIYAAGEEGVTIAATVAQAIY